jgi:hypothetical protein
MLGSPQVMLAELAPKGGPMRVANRFQLGLDVTRAIVNAKREWSTGRRQNLTEHEGRELANIVRRGPGSKLWEFQVGRAHPGDPDARGSRRLVLWEDSGQIKRIFFSKDHYSPGSWYEITG